MRAAQTIRRPALLAPRRHTAETPRRERALSSPQTLPRMGCAAAFFAGYLPGIWLGRGGSALGQQLAAYYTKSPDGTAFAAAFGAKFAVCFLQLSVVLLCGFCVWGIGLLAAFFAARGAFLGFCAASVTMENGAAGLVQYRAATMISDVAALLLCLWLADWAAQLAAELLRAACGRATRQTPGTARRLAVRYVAALAVSAVFSAVGVLLVVAAGKVWR